MKLFLTSNGLEYPSIATKFKEYFFDELKRKASFLIVSIQDTEQDAIFLQKTLRELQSVGVNNFVVLPLRDDTKIITSTYDIIYVCGGNTFDYLYRLRNSGLDKYIVSAVRNGQSSYVGVSAGSILAGPNIITASQGEFGDRNNIGLDDLSGLGLIDIVVFPHFDTNFREKIDDIRNNSSNDIREIADNEALYLTATNFNQLSCVWKVEKIR